jgi:hypothetical protein
MENIFLYIVWGIFFSVSLWGFISLLILSTISNNAWNNGYAVRMSTLKKFVQTYKAGVKALLFYFGLTYLEVRDTKIVYFLFSIMTVGISLIFLLVIKNSSWLLGPSIFCFILNIIFYYGTKHDMKKFYEGDKLSKEVYLGGSLQKTNFDSEPE